VIVAWSLVVAVLADLELLLTLAAELPAGPPVMMICELLVFATKRADPHSNRPLDRYLVVTTFEGQVDRPSII
jgi:hypothetical protein